MAIPFGSVSIGNHVKKPVEGTIWRINFSRVQWDVDIRNGKYVKRRDSSGNFLPEHNWVWSPQGVINMHYPERWGYLRFSEKNKKSEADTFVLSPAEKQKQYLWLIYYRQKDYYQKAGKYTSSQQALGLTESAVDNLFIDEKMNSLRIEASDLQFTAVIIGPDGKAWSINQEGIIREIKI